MARRNPPSALSVDDFFTHSPRELKALQARRLAAKANGRRHRSNPHRDEYLALQGYHGRVLWPRFEPGGGINSGDADYIPTMTHGALFSRDINFLRNGGGTYMGMRVTSARFNGTCKMSGNPYERGEEIVKVPEVGWCSLSAVKSQGAKENRGNRGGRKKRKFSF